MKIKQKFNAAGITGIVLLFLSPVLAFIAMQLQINQIDESMRRYDLHREWGLKNAYLVITDFSIVYIAIGMISILGCIRILIGRVYYTDESLPGRPFLQLILADRKSDRLLSWKKCSRKISSQDIIGYLYLLTDRMKCRDCKTGGCNRKICTRNIAERTGYRVVL